MIALMRHNLYFARAFKSRPYMMFWLGQTISNLGNAVFSIALAWQVLLMTHSGTAMGIVLLSASLPRLVFVLIGGVAADRLPRRRIVLWSDGGRGVIVLVVAILGFTGNLQLWHLIVEALIFGVVRGFFSPAIMSITPDLVKKDDLASASALTSISDNVTQLLGPLLGGLFIPLITPMGVFTINALSFFISAFLLISMRVSENHVASSAGMKELTTSEKGSVTKRRGLRGVMMDVGEGFVYIRGSRWLWISILCSSISNFGSAIPLGIALPLLVSNVYAQGPWLLGLMSAGGAVGSLLALLLIGQVRKIKRRGLMAYLAMMLVSLGLIILGLPFPHVIGFITAILAEVIIGFGSAFFNTIWFIIIQEMIPREKLGRVSSLDTLGSIGLMPIAQGLGGLLTDFIGPATICVISGLFCLITNVIPLCVRDIRTME
jgi:MFS family permease